MTNKVDLHKIEEFTLENTNQNKDKQHSSSPNRVVILGIDTIRHKNRSQLELMNKQGLVFDIFTNDLSGDSLEQLGELSQSNRLFRLESKFYKRLKQLITYIIKHKRSIHHAEIYSGGRFACFYGLLCQCFRVKNLVAERGDLQSILNMPSLKNRLVFQYVYKSADLVWYKEPYMESLLKNMGVKRYTMIPNAVGTPIANSIVDKDIDFIWVNRLVWRRNFEWVINYFYDEKILKTVVLGYAAANAKNLPGNANSLLNELMGTAHFEVHGYVDPVSFYQRAKFFILPATYVYGNYSLLEAMSYGVIPIVSETEATNKIVQNDINGITFNHDFESFTAAIDKARNMDESTYKLMSERVKQSIKDHFSLTQWEKKMLSMYSELQSI